MDLESAQCQFSALFRGIRQEDKLSFLQWVKQTEFVAEPNGHAEALLSKIADFLKKRVPKEGLAPGEMVAKSSALESGVLHTDAFLYPEEEDIDGLCESLHIGRWYCAECGSRRTKPLDFISHSSSAGQLKHMYQNILPDLSGKKLLDVGSRLGAVLYVGYLYSAASKLIGVEMNQFFYCLQQETVEKFKMADRVELVHGDICNQSDLLNSVDVIVLNNVFECFHDNEEQVRIWDWLFQNIRKEGCLLVTVPRVEESLQQLGHDLPVESWLQPKTTSYPLDDTSGLLGEMHLYQVIGRQS